MRHGILMSLFVAAAGCGSIKGVPLPTDDGGTGEDDKDASRAAEAGASGGTSGTTDATSASAPDSSTADTTVGPTCAPATPDRCGAACANLKTDPKNCGQCGNECAGPQQCLAGRCSPAYQNTVATGSIPGQIWDLAVAPDGAMFVAGVFKGTVDFDPGTKEEKVTALAGGDVYVTRSAADGTYQWTRTVPSTGDEPWAVAMPAADGGVFVAGYFSGTADFFPGQPGAKKTTPMSEGYVLKLMADGSFGFLRTFPGFYNSVVYEGAGLRDGGVVVAGAFSGSVDFGMGPREMGAGGGFLVKLSSTGTTSWGRTFPAKDLPMGGISAPGAAAEAADGSIFTAGTFAGTLDLDPGTGTVETMAGAGQSLFVVKLNAAGQYLDGTAVAVGAKEMYVKDLATAPDGSLYAAGSFLGSSFPLGPGGAQARSSAGSHDAFVASFTPTGEFRWAHSFGGTDYDYVIGLVSPPDGGVIATGAFRSPMIDLGSASRPDRRDPATGSLFVSKLAADGSYGGAFTIGPKLTATPSLLRPTKDGFLLGGIYASPVDFNPRAPDKDERTPIGQAVFVSRYAY